MFNFLAPFKIYLIIGAILSIIGLSWGLKYQIEQNVMKDIKISTLKQNAKEKEKKHKEDMKILEFNIKSKMQKEQIEKTFKRSKDANKNLINDDDVYFSL